MPVLLLHNYPFQRHAGYLAQVFDHVHLDVGLAVHNTGALAGPYRRDAGAGAVRQAAVLHRRVRPGRALPSGRAAVPARSGRGAGGSVAADEMTDADASRRRDGGRGSASRLRTRWSLTGASPLAAVRYNGVQAVVPPWPSTRRRPVQDHARLSIDPDYAVAPCRAGSSVPSWSTWAAASTTVSTTRAPDADAQGSAVTWPTWSGNSGWRSSATRAATSSPATTGRTASDRGPGAHAARPGVASRETNQVGTDEFLRWSRAVGVEPMMAVNLGTRGLPEAVDLVEYCNADPGTNSSDRRGQNGAAEPYGVRVWCLGNEMDGPWQIGHKTAGGVRPARRGDRPGHEAGRPGLELVACGSSHRDAYLRDLGAGRPGALPDVVEYSRRTPTTSRSTATSPRSWPARRTWTASSGSWSRPPTTSSAVAGSDKRIYVSFDEWNVWYQRRFAGEANLEIRDDPAADRGRLRRVRRRRRGQSADHPAAARRPGPMACLAQLVNVIAPIMTEPGGPAWRQTIFHPFALTSRLRPRCRGADAERRTEHRDPRYGEVDRCSTVPRTTRRTARSPSSRSTARSPNPPTCTSTCRPRAARWS